MKVQGITRVGNVRVRVSSGVNVKSWLAATNNGVANFVGYATAGGGGVFMGSMALLSASGGCIYPPVALFGNEAMYDSYGNMFVAQWKSLTYNIGYSVLKVLRLG